MLMLAAYLDTETSFSLFFISTYVGFVPVSDVLAISLSGKRVCDSPSIRVSEISVYYENRWVVPMLGKDLFTLHFAKA